MTLQRSCPVVIASADRALQGETFAQALGATFLRGGRDLRAALESLESVTGCLMLGYEAVAAETLRARHPNAAQIVVSAEPPPSDVTCWFPNTPSITTIAALLGPGPTSHRPRRKSDTIVGNSPAIIGLIDKLGRLAPSPATVLITGETGTGKELVARALHYSSGRAPQAFVAINCAAIPETLMEAELFGHQRGAFTGAVAARAGAFEAAEGGTLFLDEIGELPLSMQPKLLRVLDTNEVTRLGSNTPVPTTARVIAATNRSLEEETRAGRFREDLYYRIGVHTIEVPPLRDRAEDITSIVTHHLAMIAEREHLAIPRFTSAAIAKLLTHGWPGNVRELVGTIERAVLSAHGGVIDAKDLSIRSNLNTRPGVLPYRAAKEDFERVYYERLMRATKGNVSMAAVLAKKTRKEIYDALRRTGLGRARTTKTAGRGR